MKITGFNPSILTNHSDDVIRLFEEMGFEIHHQDMNPEGIVSGSVRLKNAGGFAVDVTGTDHFRQDITVIRMNVDDFDEGYRVVERKEVMLFEEVDDKSNKIIEFCTDPKSTKEIMEYLGFKERKSAFKYLRPLVEQGRIAKTIPDKPKSSKQRYVSIK